MFVDDSIIKWVMVRLDNLEQSYNKWCSLSFLTMELLFMITLKSTYETDKDCERCF